MAQTFKFDLRNFERKLSVYELSQANFAGKVTLTKLAKRLKGSQGLKQRYKRIFDDPVPFTLNSTFTVQRGLELDVGIKDKIEDGNPAGKYLFPPIGVGSGRAYDTLFTQYLRNRNLIDKGEYPYPVTDNPVIRLNKYGNVSGGTYRATEIGLGKTRNQGNNKKAFKGGASIPEERVFVVKKSGQSKNKRLKAGIYREVQGGKSIRALFFYGKIPTQSKGGSRGTKMFPEIVKEFTDAQLFKIWLREIKNLAK